MVQKYLLRRNKIRLQEYYTEDNMSENEKLEMIKERIFLMAQSVKAHLDYPKILKCLYKGAAIEYKNLQKDRFELTAHDKNEVCELSKTLVNLTQRLYATKKIAEYRTCEEQLDALIAKLDKDLHTPKAIQAVTQAAENFSTRAENVATAAGQAASAAFEKAKTAVTEGIKNIKKKIDND